jgi:hypothetical protein
VQWQKKEAKWNECVRSEPSVRGVRRLSVRPADSASSVLEVYVGKGPKGNGLSFRFDPMDFRKIEAK